MAILTWNETYSVGIKTFDEHHQHLISFINSLYDAMKEGKGNQEVQSTIQKLIEYTVFHFSSEEKLLLEKGYPGYPIHLKEHQALKARVIDFQDRINKGELGMSVKLANFLKEWLTSHILGEDKKYGPFLQAKGIK